MADDKSYIIDPLTSLCKVALLHFLPEKTKLAINHHILYIQGYSYYQWIERMINHDSRIDISNLNTPFIKAVKWYILDGSERAQMDRELVESIRIITKFAIKGLVKLQSNTYSTDIAIKIVLQYLINMLNNALSDNWVDETYVKSDSNNILTDKIKNNFEPNAINSIAKMLSDADKIENSADDISALIECAHQLLINRDTVFAKMMKDINTVL